MLHAYSLEDLYWGQLSGCLESINAGTTTVLDHAHCASTPDHGTLTRLLPHCPISWTSLTPCAAAPVALDAMLDSGLRAVFGYCVPIRMAKWDQSHAVPEQDPLPGWALEQLGDLAQKYNSRPGLLVEVAMGFDLWYLPKDMVLAFLDTLGKKGLRLVTSHIERNAFFGKFVPESRVMAFFTRELTSWCKSTGLEPPIRKLQSYDLLRSPQSKSSTNPDLPFLVLSHCNGLSDSDLALLATTGTPISSTPGTESYMALGNPVALNPIFKSHPKTANASLGIDCHSANSASMPTQARMVLQLARVEKHTKLLDEEKFVSGNVTGSVEEAFNLVTIRGARCLGLENEVGSIKVGKKADLVVFDAVNSVGLLSAAEHDPLVAVVKFSETADVETVIVNGVVRKRGGKLVAAKAGFVGAGDDAAKAEEKKTMEWGQIADQVRRSQKDIQARIDGLNLEKAREMLLNMFYVDTSKLVDDE